MLDTSRWVFRDEKFCNWCKKTKSGNEFGLRYRILANGERVCYLRPYCVPCSRGAQRLYKQTKPQKEVSYATVG